MRGEEGEEGEGARGGGREGARCGASSAERDLAHRDCRGHSPITIVTLIFIIIIIIIIIITITITIIIIIVPPRAAERDLAHRGRRFRERLGAAAAVPGRRSAAGSALASTEAHLLDLCLSLLYQE